MINVGNEFTALLVVIGLVVLAIQWIALLAKAFRR